MTAAARVAQRAGRTGHVASAPIAAGLWDGLVRLSPFPAPNTELKARSAGSTPVSPVPSGLRAPVQLPQKSPGQRPGSTSGAVAEGSTHLSRQATLRHFSGAEGGGGEVGRAPASGRGVATAEAVGAGSLSRRMESMRVAGDRGVSAAGDRRPGLANSTWGLRGGLGGSSLTRTRGLLDRGLHGGERGHTCQQAPCWPSLPRCCWEGDSLTPTSRLCSRLGRPRGCWAPAR